MPKTAKPARATVDPVAAEVERRQSVIGAVVRPQVERSGIAIGRKVEDAKAHAGNAMTGSLIETDDGRATAARAARSRSLDAAFARLDELAAILAGPSSRSLEGAIRDAWALAMADGIDYWLATSHPDDVRPGKVGASIDDEHAARSILLGGYDARQLVAAPIETAKRTLKALVNHNASPTRTGKDRVQALRAWQVATAKAIAQAVGIAIFTGAYRTDVLAIRAVLKPELLHPDPTIGRT